MHDNGKTLRFRFKKFSRSLNQTHQFLDDNLTIKNQVKSLKFDLSIIYSSCIKFTGKVTKDFYIRSIVRHLSDASDDR